MNICSRGGFLLLFVVLFGLRLGAQTPETIKFRMLERLQKVPNLVNAGKYEEALPELNTIIAELAPLIADDPAMRVVLSQAYYMQGVCNLELENYAATVESFSTFIQREPVHPNVNLARLMQGEAHFYQEEWSSIPPVVLPVANAPTTPFGEKETAFQLLAISYTNLEKWEDALPYHTWLFKRSRNADTRKDSASSMAICLIRLNRYEDLYQLQPRLSISRANRDIAMNLLILDEGDSFLSDARPDLALLMYRMVVPYGELKGELETRQATIATTMKNLENLPVKSEMIRQQYRQLTWEKERLEEEAENLEAYPDYDLELRVRLGDVYHELERWEESIQVYLSVYEIDPESEVAERAMFAAFLTAFRAEEPYRAWEIAQIYMEKYPGGEYWEDVTLHSGTLLVNLERWFEAVDVVDRALEITPNHVTLDNMLYIKAYAQFQQSLIRESIQTMNTLLRNHPQSSFAQNAKYWVALGHLFLEEYPEARQGFMQIVQDDDGGPVQEDSNYRMGVAEYGLGDFPAATRTFTDFLNKYPDSHLASEALAMIGDMLASESELDLAIDHYQRAVDQAVNMVQADYATFQQARTYELEKRWHEILDLFENYLDQFPDRANFTEATYWRGNALRQLGRQEEALQIFVDAISKHGNDPYAFGIDFILRDLTEELSSLNQQNAMMLNLRERLQDEMARAAENQERTLLLRLQALQYDLTQNQDIKDSLQTALLHRDNFPYASPGVLAQMGRLSEASENKDLARDVYEYFVENYYDSDLIQEALRNLAELRIQEKRYAEAEDLLRSVTDRFPGIPQAAEAYLRLGDVYRLQEKWSEAIEIYNLVASVKDWRGPIWPTALNRLGDTHHQMGDPLKASGFYERVYVMYLGYPEQAAEAYYKRALALQELGQNDKARDVLNEMLEEPELARLPLANEARAMLMKLP